MAATEQTPATEQRFCNRCGEIWVDTGDDLCPFCDSDDTGIVLEDPAVRWDLTHPLWHARGDHRGSEQSID